MLWSSTSDVADESQDSTDGGYAGLYRWTMDALFGSRVSPSRKYKEFAQDDTNYKYKRESGVSPEHSMLRSNSWSGLDSAFYRRNELLPPKLSEEFDNIPRATFNSSSSPPLLNPRAKDQVTDTFGGRKKDHKDMLDDDECSIIFQSPRPDDPIISKLFGKKGADKKVSAEDINSIHSRKVKIPGMFPSPMKASKKPLEKDYTADYLQILDQLDRNGRMLEEVNRDIQEKQNEHQMKERAYKEKYLETRAELINELRHSKKLYDNYYKLYGKYQQLREISQHAVKMQHKIEGLESQLIDNSIEKEKQIHALTRKVFEVELKVQESESRREREVSQYQARIAELEEKILLQPDVGVSSLSFSPSHFRDQSSDYHAMVDSQFLKNLT